MRVPSGACPGDRPQGAEHGQSRCAVFFTNAAGENIKRCTQCPGRAPSKATLPRPHRHLCFFSGGRGLCIIAQGQTVGQPAGSILDSLDMQISLGGGFSLEAVCVVREVRWALPCPSPPSRAAAPVWPREQRWALHPPTSRLPPHLQGQHWLAPSLGGRSDGYPFCRGRG